MPELVPAPARIPVPGGASRRAKRPAPFRAGAWDPSDGYPTHDRPAAGVPSVRTMVR
ncbi:MAG TPA: hypothetical protein VGD72_11000 [Mycobacteriales bacterium]|jgi:hypothetical protein